MSEAEHRAEARELRADSRDHRSQVDESSTRRAESNGAIVQGDLPTFDPASGPIYNPSAESHDRRARRLREGATLHEAAADALAQYEEQTCGQIPREERALCPLLGHVASVRVVARGVEITFEDAESANRALPRIQCHLAFARAQGREGMDACPLYLPGVSAEAAGDIRVLLSVDSNGDVDEVLRRARLHVIGQTLKGE